MPSGDEIRAVRTTFRVLHALQEIDGYTGVSELAEHLDMPVSTVHSHLTTLRNCEYVVKRGSEYNLGYRFLESGGQLRKRTRLYQFAKPKIDQIAAEFGDEVALIVEEHGLAAHVYIERGEQAIETDTHTGIRLPIHSTAGGKVMLAFEPEERVKEIIDRRGLSEYGPNCITSYEELTDQLAEIRETGVAFGCQERIEGIRSVAVPLPREESEPNAALAVSGPVSRMNGERFEEDIPDRLGDIAETIRIKLRYA